MLKITKPAEVTEGFHGILYGKPKVFLQASNFAEKLLLLKLNSLKLNIWEMMRNELGHHT